MGHDPKGEVKGRMWSIKGIREQGMANNKEE